MTLIEEEKELLLKEMKKGTALLVLIGLVKKLLGKADGFIKLWLRNLRKNAFWR